METCVRYVEKPWGWELVWAENAGYTGKLLHVDGGRRLSRQYHALKHETLCLLKGRAMLEVGEGAGVEQIRMVPLQGYVIPVRCVHRLIALDGGAEIVEASSPEIGRTVSLDDDYGRAVSVVVEGGDQVVAAAAQVESWVARLYGVAV